MPSGPPTQSKVPSIVLWVNTTLNRLMSSFSAISSSATIALRQGDVVSVEVHLLRSDADEQMTEYQLPVSGGLTLAIGKIDAAPTSGDFQLSYNSEATSVLQHNATASQVQVALNALPSIASMGGVAVIKNATIYRITWNSTVAVPLPLVVSRNTLYPSSSVALTLVASGSVTVNHSVQMHTKQIPVANILSFEPQDPSVVFYSKLRDAAFNGDSNIWRIELNIIPKGGSFVISFNVGTTPYTTNPIPVGSSALEIQKALNSEFSSSWSVSKNASYSWDISTNNYFVNGLAVDSSTIISYNSKYGILNLNTIQVEELLSGSPSATAVLEIELESSGTHKTLYQGDCTILNDLIDTDIYSLYQYGDYIPASSVVRYDTSQSLTDSQKLQARTNINAVDISEISLLQLKDIQLEGRISNIEVQSLDTNKVDAINNNGTLSGTNPVVSLSQLVSNLSGYAGILHTHQISDISSLRNELDIKTNIGHTHNFFSIDGLAGQLSLKLNTADATLLYSSINHTHNAFTDIALDSLVCFGDITAENLEVSSISSNAIAIKNLVQIGGNIGGTSYNQSQLILNGNLNINNSGLGEGIAGMITCRDIVVSKKVTAEEIIALKFTNPFTGTEFDIQNAVILSNYGQSGNPAPVTFGDYIEIQFGEQGPKFRLSAFQMP